MKIQSLYFYPVKSCGPVQTRSLPLETEGPRWDREWMIVGEEGKFVTQRDLPGLALVQPALDAGALHLSGPEGGVSVPLESNSRGTRRVEIWGQNLEAWDEGAGASRWLSDLFGRRLFLVRRKEIRLAGKEKDRSVRFPDSYPILLCNRESLEDLNARAGMQLDMLRFRPNLVLEGGTPFAEDGWKAVKIAGTEFPVGKACTRCSITLVDPQSGEKGAEPLRTLATYRKKDGKVEFGQYLLSATGVILTEGMPLEAIR